MGDMSSGRSLGRAVVGGLCAGLGALLAGAGVMRYAFLDVAFLGGAGPFLAIAAGLLLCVFGVILVLMPGRVDGPLPSVPAHVAFSQRAAVRPLTAPVMPARSAAATAADHKPRAPIPHSPRNREPSLAQLDDEIQELTRKINKAGVLLATGQLSTQGYRHYVGDLKKQRGKLEATRVKAELHKA